MKLEQVENIINMQQKLNDGTAGKGWEEGVAKNGRDINWRLCIQMEYAELLDSTNWKHWKDISKPDDIENIKMELVDIIHFITSLAISEDVTHDVIEVLTNKGAQEIDKKGIQQYIMSDFNTKSAGDLTKVFVLICEFYKFSMNELYKLYMVKNVLNSFRQKNGYADGSYIKIWEDGNEDNVYAMALMDIIDDPIKLDDALTKKYNDVLEANK